jgi:hypothetical protein
MKSIQQGHSKLENPTNMDRVNSILVRPQAKKKDQIITFNLEATRSLDDQLLKYCVFEVQEDGYYTVSNQLCIKCNSKATINFVQFGVCKDDLSDFGTDFNSTVSNCSCDAEIVLSYNLSCIKYLAKDVKYCCWLNFSSSANANFSYVSDYSHLMILQVCK